MGKKSNYLFSLSKNKKGIRFTELVKVLKENGYTERNIAGSHHVYGKQGHLPIMIVKPHGGKNFCHPKDVNKVINLLKTVNNEQ